MIVKAKFICESVKDFGVQKEVQCTAVTRGSEENLSFHKYTPSGTLTMLVDNPTTDGFFKPGKEFYVNFEEAPDEE